MRRSLTTVVVLTVLTATGCGTADPAATPAPQQAPAVRATPSTSAPRALDAAAVVKKLQAADLGLSRVAVQDEDTDPNNLLGRPNGYLTRASADLPGGNEQADKYGIDRGMVIETFPDSTTTARRSEYIQGLLKGLPLLRGEWHYIAGDGLVLVRVSGSVKPSLAKRVEAAVKKM